MKLKRGYGLVFANGTRYVLLNDSMSFSSSLTPFSVEHYDEELKYPCCPENTTVKIVEVQDLTTCLFEDIDSWLKGKWKNPPIWFPVEEQTAEELALECLDFIEDEEVRLSGVYYALKDTLRRISLGNFKRTDGVIS